MNPDAELDCVGLFCPMPIARTKEEIEKIEVGQVLKVEADDPAAEEDIKRWAKRTGHELLKFERSGNVLTFWIKKMK
ncbi:MAG: sulfurtransferase TusA family protein [Methanotrichaceae archaeon]